jgi:nicotinate-nucleotide adenylyltransferase
MKTGLFFGSFNPIHNGHIAIAGYILEFTDLEEIWFVVSPQNPLKKQHLLAPDKHRLEMTRLAIEDFKPKISLCDIEMNMPRPSYTVDTLKALDEQYPMREFAVLMGADSMESIHRWKGFETLLNSYRIMVYPRLGSNVNKICRKYKVEIIDAPIMEISSTFLRSSILKNKKVDYFMPIKAYRYLINNNLYKAEIDE